MTAIVMKKNLGALYPTDEQGQAALAKIRHGELIMVDWRKARNPAHHRKFFSLLKVVMDNTESFPSTDALLTVIKIMVGHVDVVVSKKGETFYHPKSINFASMAQAEFEKFYTAALDAICTRVIPGADRHDFESEVAMRIAERPEAP